MVDSTDDRARMEEGAGEGGEARCMLCGKPLDIRFKGQRVCLGRCMERAIRRLEADPRQHPPGKYGIVFYRDSGESNRG